MPYILNSSLYYKRLCMASHGSVLRKGYWHHKFCTLSESLHHWEDVWSILFIDGPVSSTVLGSGCMKPKGMLSKTFILYLVLSRSSTLFDSIPFWQFLFNSEFLFKKTIAFLSPPVWQLWNCRLIFSSANIESHSSYIFPKKKKKIYYVLEALWMKFVKLGDFLSLAHALLQSRSLQIMSNWLLRPISHRERA